MSHMAGVSNAVPKGINSSGPCIGDNCLVPKAPLYAYDTSEMTVQLPRKGGIGGGGGGGVGGLKLLIIPNLLPSWVRMLG